MRRVSNSEALGFSILIGAFLLGLLDLLRNSTILLIARLWDEYLFFRVTSFILIISIVAFLVVTFYFVYKINTKSVHIQKLKPLNNSTDYKYLPELVTKNYSINSKKNLDNTEPKDILYNELFEGYNPFEDDVKKAFYNDEVFNNYKKSSTIILNEMKEDNNHGKNHLLNKYFKFIELKFFKRNVLPDPVTNPKFIVKLNYTSPQGRNSYSKTGIYYKTSFAPLIEQVIEDEKRQEKERNSRLIERRKMSDSLRFKILKKYDYKCQLCGKTAKDGVALHVDHIKPIAKGGLTTESNLWVLCDRCNLGKGTRSL